MSDGDETVTRMQVGEQHSGKVFVDYLGFCNNDIVIEQDGWAEFVAKAGSVSVWAEKN